MNINDRLPRSDKWNFKTLRFSKNIDNFLYQVE